LTNGQSNMMGSIRHYARWIAPGRSDMGVKITHYDRHYERHIAAISTCHGHVDVSTIQPSRLLRCRLGIGQTELKQLQATASFRQKLKTHLFCLTYGAENTAL